MGVLFGVQVALTFACLGSLAIFWLVCRRSSTEIKRMVQRHTDAVLNAVGALRNDLAIAQILRSGPKEPSELTETKSVEPLVEPRDSGDELTAVFDRKEERPTMELPKGRTTPTQMSRRPPKEPKK
jgi:hypothetical protein